MKLTTQGLIVIFCPVAFQLLLVTMLLVLIVQAQDETERNIHSESVVNECNLIVARVFDGLGAFIMSHTGRINRSSVPRLLMQKKISINRFVNCKL